MREGTKSGPHLFCTSKLLGEITERMQANYMHGSACSR